MVATTTHLSESENLQRLEFPFEWNLDPVAARSLLGIRMDRQAIKYINQLLRKNQKGTISADERMVLEKYIHMGKFLDVLHAKARNALKKAGVSE